MRRADALVGEHGVVLCEIMMVPLMELATQWMGVEAFSIALHEYPDRLAALLPILDGHYARAGKSGGGGRRADLDS